jgi:UDP-N-acetylmuramoylalanine--D-glutamate ligase
MKVTIMGLGRNGGGVGSAGYLALRGAECTVTDMGDEKTLASSIEKLESLAGPHRPFRYVLGRHEMEDFTGADLVIKNPAVKPHSPYLAAARRVETDISLFLAASPARLIAVTGSKGKSSVSSAIHWVLEKARQGGGAEEKPARGRNLSKDGDPPSGGPLLPGKAYLGGNITVSPLSFLDKLGEEDDAVLELSSWQLGDLRGRKHPDHGRPLLKPRVAVLTAIMRDHQDRYGSMEPYVEDKRVIYRGQDRGDVTVAGADDDWGRGFLAESPGRPLPYSAGPLPPGTAGGWIDGGLGAGLARPSGGGDGPAVEVVPPNPLVPGGHQKKNLLAAALALLDLGLPAPFIRKSLGNFPGIEHRLEFFHEKKGVRFYNDTAATVPEAAAAAVETLTGGESPSGAAAPPLILVTGGTDKELDFSPLVRAAAKAAGVVLLAGSGSGKLIPLLNEAGIPYRGPCDDIDTAAGTALELAEKAARGGGAAVVLSPGCASFDMFRDEFDRGRLWKAAVIGR